MRKIAVAFLAVLAGFFSWFFVATVGNLVIRVALPGYAAVEKTMDFSLVMLIARLALGAISSVGAGLCCATVFRAGRVPGYVLAALLLAVFVPIHISIWEKFPVWYHIVFLGSLVPLTLLGARLLGNPSRKPDQHVVSGAA